MLNVPYTPQLPAQRPGIGIVGCGSIVKGAHLPAYQKYGLRVVGVYDVAPEATVGVQERFGVEHVFASLDELLAHPEIEIVDVGTFPQERLEISRRALRAGKHLLLQKPFTPDLASARAIIAEAHAHGRMVAINQNGRWSPPWRIATLLIEQGVIGEVLAVTHLFDVHFDWLTGLRFDTIPHWCIYDYGIHWIDITRCWLAGKQPVAARASEYRPPNQPAASIAPWGLNLEFTCADGSNALIRSIGGAQTRHSGHPFWIHGTRGTIRGSVLGQDFVEVETGGTTTRYDLDGAWFPDAFAGSMGELMTALAAGREPYNSAENNLRTLQMVFAACRSADVGGQAVALVEDAP
jgi:predicted dehydrogenase